MEEYDKELTAAEVLNKLNDAWLNEKHSPEKMELVECMLEQVTGNCFSTSFNCQARVLVHLQSQYPKSKLKKGPELKL